MAEEKDTKIKVTDRRKFNPDGTPREQTAESAEPQPEPASPQSQAAPAAPPAEDAVQSNVVSFPGEAAKKKDRPETEAPPREAAAPDRAGAQPDDAARAQDAQARAAASAAEQAYNQMKGGGVPGAPEASFLGLLDMLAGEAAMCLGMVKNPSGAELPIDLDAARQIIDMLAMLQRKTAGNLDAEEKDVLENILAYLRMQFVSLSRNK
ncbi:MAG: DUF1844 domain-containing protein [Blastocatellia bacterium]